MKGEEARVRDLTEIVKQVRERIREKEKSRRENKLARVLDKVDDHIVYSMSKLGISSSNAKRRLEEFKRDYEESLRVRLDVSSFSPEDRQIVDGRIKFNKKYKIPKIIKELSSKALSSQPVEPWIDLSNNEEHYKELFTFIHLQPSETTRSEGYLMLLSSEISPKRVNKFSPLLAKN